MNLLNESEPEDDGDESEHDGHTCVYFWPDVEPEDNSACVVLEDPRLAQVEGARRLEVEQELDALGTYSIYLPFNLRWVMLIHCRISGFFEG